MLFGARMPEKNVKIELKRKNTVVFYTRTRVAVKNILTLVGSHIIIRV